MTWQKPKPARLLAAAAVLAVAATAPLAHAAPLLLRVTIENLAPSNSVSFAPLRVGFSQGVFDAFNVGETATAPIISVAEGGSGADWFPAFAAAEPNATLGTVGGLLQPGNTASTVFVVDGVLNPFFTFGSMVVPSNDFFIGNDDPKEYRLFDAAGNLVMQNILQTASDIWDAGSEAFDPAAAAFVGNNGLRTPQNGVVSFNFSELAGFDGLTTATGYTFVSGLQRDTDIYRISFQVVPTPGSVSLAGLGLLGLCVLRRRRDPSATAAASRKP
jgi:hypothetical protein